MTFGFKNEINRAFHPAVKVVSVLEKPHKIEFAGGLELSEVQKASSLKIAKQLPYNESVAIIQDRDALVSPNKTLKYIVGSFSDMLAIKKSNVHNQAPPITAGGILTCVERGSVIFHRRSADTHSHPNCLSMFGGYMNPDIDKSIEENAIREIEEEIGISLASSAEELEYPYLLLEQEPIKDNYQFSFLGLDITQGQFKNLKTDDEGEIVEVMFDQLAAVLDDRNRWAPIGLLLTISWLALDAPTSHKILNFDAIKAAKYYKEWMSKYGVSK